MILKCISNKLDSLPPSLQDMAWPLDEAGELIDITLHKYYAVYATDQFEDQKIYLVHTDTENVHSFWWMPECLYDVYDTTEPRGWQNIEHQLRGYSSLNDWQVSEGLIDGETEYIDEYMAEVLADPTFPTDAELDTLNVDVNNQRAHDIHEQAVNDFHEKGWEITNEEK